MVPTAEMTVVLVPLAVVVTETTAGSVAVVVMMAGWVTGMAESHLLFLFCASAVAVVELLLVDVGAEVLEALVPFFVPVTNSILVRSFLAFSSLSISTFCALANAS